MNPVSKIGTCDLKKQTSDDLEFVCYYKLCHALLLNGAEGVIMRAEKGSKNTITKSCTALLLFCGETG